MTKPTALLLALLTFLAGAVFGGGLEWHLETKPTQVKLDRYMRWAMEAQEEANALRTERDELKKQLR